MIGGLLKMAKVTRDQAVAAELASKAADLNSRSEEKQPEATATWARALPT